MDNTAPSPAPSVSSQPTPSATQPPPPPATLPVSPQSQNSLPNSTDPSHLYRSPASSTNPPSNPVPTLVPSSPSDPALIAANVPPPSTDSAMSSIIPEPPSPLTGRSVFDDSANPKKDLYSSSTGSIFVKNFIAGFARAFGSIVVYLIFLFITLYLSSRYLYPQLKPLIDTFQKLTEISSSPAASNLDPQQLQHIIQGQQ